MVILGVFVIFFLALLLGRVFIKQILAPLSQATLINESQAILELTGYVSYLRGFQLTDDRGLVNVLLGLHVAAVLEIPPEINAVSV